tara:strand:- start:706 stop:1737 length:1032 start_codon:yes stop_codon:yes gene_type:complete
MASTYVNDLRLNEMSTGDQSGSWGTVTNLNLELIGEAFSFGTENITTNADTHTTTIADGQADPGRSMFLKYTGTLDSACTITIGPNTVSKMWFIENGTSGSQNIIISQGSGANVTIASGQTKAVYSNGAGSGAAFVDAFSTLNVAGVTSTELAVLDGVTATTAELNILDGVTSTTAELNILDGVTSTAAELNILDGVTATAAELNYLDIVALGTSAASKVVTSDANNVVTFSGGITEDSVTITSSSAAATLNMRLGTNFLHDLTENVTYTFSNPAASGNASAFTLKVIQDSTARAITWPSSVDWPAATAPTLTATNNGVDMFVFQTIDGGTTWYGFVAGQALG